MMHIDISKLVPDEEWKREAELALQEARKKLDKQERSKFINGKSTLWKDLKPKLEDLSHGKCWYCESLEKRSDRAVDHYRPKGNVHGVNHGGYWWRAFRADNFRLSCTYCNSRRRDRDTGTTGGKGDFFPLCDENKRVYSEDDDPKCKQENPLLLDPCKRSDVFLLWFSQDGLAVPRYGEDENALAFRKAHVSIEYYHLNEKEIKEVRQGLFHRINDLVEQGDYYFEDSLTGDPNAGMGISRTMEDLEKLKEWGAEFSAFSKAIIAGLRKPGREWLDTI